MPRVCLAISLIIILISSCRESSGVKTLRLAHGLDTNHPVHEAMVFMAERVYEKSNGQLKMKIYPSGQLGAERECLELLQIGSLDMTKVSAAVMENFAPEYEILSLPYIFKNKQHAYKTFDGAIGKEFLEAGEKFRLRGLCFYDAGSRSFYTKDKPVEEPEDLKGLKIRVQKSKTAVTMVELMGASPTPISWGELYTALQQGVVDGAENNPPSFYFSRHYEVCKYYSLNEHTSVPDVLLMGTGTWEKLTSPQKRWLQDAAYESAAYQRKLWNIAEKESLAEVAKAGVKLLYPPKEKFARQVKAMHDSYQSKPGYGRIMSEIEKLEEQAI